MLQTGPLTKPELTNPLLQNPSDSAVRSVTVTADWLLNSYPAYFLGKGSTEESVPYFTKEAGLALMLEMPELSFLAGPGAFMTMESSAEKGGHPRYFFEDTVPVDGTLVTVYPIGLGSWDWRLA